MQPLAALPAEVTRRLRGVVFDLDDTVLDGGALSLEAYEALFRLRDAGLSLIACTGRPSGWGEVIARQWPVAAVVVENGALAWLREAPVGRIRSTDALSVEARGARRAPLLSLGRELVARFPAAALADDNGARVTDVTIDIGEHHQVSAGAVQAMRDEARGHGVRTHASSVHLHLTFEHDDKASGTVRLLVERFGEDATAARHRWAYVGDSGNDAQAFAAFPVSFGVLNVREHLRALSVPPAFVAAASRGAGFAEIARAIAAGR